jgi:ferredoxin
MPRPPQPPGTGPLILFSRSKLSVPWDPASGSLLELTEACDVPVSFGCRSGACHYCQSGWVIGKVSYQPEPPEQPPPGCARSSAARSRAPTSRSTCSGRWRPPASVGCPTGDNQTRPASRRPSAGEPCWPMPYLDSSAAATAQRSRSALVCRPACVRALPGDPVDVSSAGPPGPRGRLAGSLPLA